MRFLDVNRNLEWYHIRFIRRFAFAMNQFLGTDIPLSVTIGKADIFEDWKNSKVEGLVIEKGAVLCAGAKFSAKRGYFVSAMIPLLPQMRYLPIQQVHMKSGREPAKLIGYNMHALVDNGLEINQIQRGTEK